MCSGLDSVRSRVDSCSGKERERASGVRGVASMVCGRRKSCPFSDSLLRTAAETIKKCVPGFGAKLDLEEVPGRQPFKRPLIEEFLRISGDPDFRVWQWSQVQAATMLAVFSRHRSARELPPYRGKHASLQTIPGIVQCYTPAPFPFVL